MSSTGLMYYVALAIIVVALRLCAGWRGRNGLILLVSGFVYVAWEPRCFGLLLVSICVDYLCALGIQRSCEHTWIRKAFLGVSVATNLGLLLTFKYLNFFVLSAQTCLRQFGLEVETHLLQTTIPIGISFYTFQTLGYTIDVYRRRVEAETNLLVFASYVAFFPQLVAGPIERASRLIPQLRRTRPLDWSRWNSGMQLLGRGLFEKIVIAGNIAPIVDHVFSRAPDQLAAIDVYCVAFAFMAQLYFDLSGYTNIARGSARLMGIELSLNFRAPFLARSPVTFWARWHISVTGWFQTYVTSALRGAWAGTHDPRWIILAVTALIGLWHGPSWNFVLFGVYHGLWLIVSQRTWTSRGAEPARRGRVLLRWLVFVHALALSGLIFRSPSAAHLVDLLHCLATPASGVTPLKSSVAHATCILVFGLALADQWWFETKPRAKLPLVAKSILYALAIVVFVLFGAFDASEYIYIQF